MERKGDGGDKVHIKKPILNLMKSKVHQENGNLFKPPPPRKYHFHIFRKDKTRDCNLSD